MTTDLSERLLSLLLLATLCRSRLRSLELNEHTKATMNTENLISCAEDAMK